MTPLISIIIPVYNGEKYIEKCLQGLLGQTYSNLEIIVVNNGSTDNTLSLCQTLRAKDSRIKVYNAVGKGVSLARNLGLEKATGEYIGFVDVDDYIEPDMYEYLYELLSTYQADISSCNIEYVRSKKIYSVSPRTYTGFDAFEQCVSNYGVFVSIWNKLYSRKVIGNIRFPDIQLSEDFKFLYDIFSRPVRLVCGEHVKYHYDVQTYKEISVRDWEAVEMMKNLLAQTPASDKKRISLLKTCYLKQLFSSYIKCVSETKKTYYHHLIISESRRKIFSFWGCRKISLKFKIFVLLLTVNKHVAQWLLNLFKN